MKTLKLEIKRLADNQKSLKNQRKTVHLQGERTISPYEAWLTHRVNRGKLKDLYAVLAIQQGRSLDTVEVIEAALIPKRIEALSKTYQTYFDESLVCAS